MTKSAPFLAAALLALGACQQEAGAPRPSTGTAPPAVGTAVARPATPPAAAPAPVAQALAARLEGRWTGFWDGLPSNATVLTIQQVTAGGEVRGTYQFQNGNPTQFVAQFENGAFSFGSTAAGFTFREMPDGRLRGERRFVWQGVQGTNTAVLSRN